MNSSALYGHLYALSLSPNRFRREAGWLRKL